MVRTVHSSLEQEVRFCSKTIFRFLGCMPTSGPVRSLPSIRNWSDFSAQFVETSHGNNSFLLFRHRTRRKLCNMSEEIWGSAAEEGKEGERAPPPGILKEARSNFQTSKVEKLNPVRNTLFSSKNAILHAGIFTNVFSRNCV